MIYYTSQIKLLLFAILFLGTATAIFAADGDLDPTFDGDGIVITDNGSTTDSIFDLVFQPDGKIIAAGFSSIGSSSTARTVIVRYNPNGSIDSTFGTGGKVIVPSVSPSGLALQANGKIVFVGTSGQSPSRDFYIARLNSDGGFDMTFNGTGAVTLDLRGTSDIANSVKIQPDGKIVVAGESASPASSTERNGAVVRFNADGSLDSTFDSDGKVFLKIDPQSTFETLSELVIQSDGKILAAGDASSEKLIMVRYNPDGSLDTTFDNDGKVTFYGGGVFFSLAFQSDGKLLAAGYRFVRDGLESILIRFNVDGSRDSSFGIGGQVIIPGSLFTAVIISADKRIVVARRGEGLVRYNADGSRDLSFSSEDKFEIRAAFIRVMAIQPDGKIIIGGEIGISSNTDFILARFEASICRTETCSGERQKVADFDGDGRTDLSVFRNGTWFINPSGANNPNSFYGVPFGLATDKLTPADYDGDGKTDIAVWRENVNGTFGYFYILQSLTNSIRIAQFGQTGDDPRIVGDWDGDGKADLAVYRSGASAGAQSYFYYRPSSQPATDFVRLNWGTAGDEALRGDYDGDGRMDAAVFRPSDGIWYIRQSSNNQPRYERWGLATDKRVAGDFDGDGKTDLAVYRDGLWAVLQSSNNQPRYEYWGLSSDRIAAGDYDGDGRTDFAVWRAGVYYILQNSNSQVVYQYFGSPNDIPVASAFVR